MIFFWRIKNNLISYLDCDSHFIFDTICNLNGRENDERTQVDTNTNKITPGLNGA